MSLWVKWSTFCRHSEESLPDNEFSMFYAFKNPVVYLNKNDIAQFSEYVVISTDQVFLLVTELLYKLQKLTFQHKDMQINFSSLKSDL